MAGADPASACIFWYLSPRICGAASAAPWFGLCAPTASIWRAPDATRCSLRPCDVGDGYRLGYPLPLLAAAIEKLPEFIAA